MIKTTPHKIIIQAINRFKLLIHTNPGHHHKKLATYEPLFPDHSLLIDS